MIGGIEGGVGTRGAPEVVGEKGSGGIGIGNMGLRVWLTALSWLCFKVCISKSTLSKRLSFSASREVICCFKTGT